MIANTLEDDMILVIFGSNLIERAGLNLDHTKRLCQAIFRGEHYEMTERSGPYEQRSQGWLQAKHAASGEGEKHQIRQRAEVVQHALALRYIVDAIVTTRDRPFSEDILKETHRILITGVDHPRYDTPMARVCRPLPESSAPARNWADGRGGQRRQHPLHRIEDGPASHEAHRGCPQRRHRSGD